jgi:predicted transcriptional regulator of viral defense system
MTQVEPLQGAEFRIFRSLVREWDRDSLRSLEIEMTRRVPYLSREEIAEVLAALEERGYVEEHEPGHWRLTPNGHGVKRSLLGELVA